MNDDDDIKVYVVPSIAGTPAVALAIAGWVDCNERGLGDGTMNLANDQKAMLAFAKNGQEMLPVGVMTWSFDESARRVWIFQSYVVKEFRGRGVYRAMWHHMVQHAEELAARTIQSATHADNKTMRSIAAKLGRREEAVVLRYDL